MQVIPVIDIRNGAVVRAVAGRRSEYRPVETPLAKTSAPRDVACGLMSLHPFRTLYIADLDAIEGRGNNRASIASIGEDFPRLRLWVDAGLARADEASDWLSLNNVEVVFGSESLYSADELRAVADRDRIILSLDFKGGNFLGPEELLLSSALWPKRVVVMTLARVGTREGPDFARFSHILRCAGDREIIAAGGVRGLGDLIALKEAGAAATLVATTLHDGRLTRADLMRFHAE
jgi:phosphoribosylformimino-5-aminoimidazole carboxamide ribotide isomerase